MMDVPQMKVFLISWESGYDDSGRAIVCHFTGTQAAEYVRRVAEDRSWRATRITEVPELSTKLNGPRIIVS